jgi:PLP dependent protein
MTTVCENIMSVRERIRNAALACGRNEKDIRIIAVTKTIPPETINEAIKCGLCDIGENRVQELCRKDPMIDPGRIWHMIGHLQANKVKYIIDKVQLIHSVDSIALAREISGRAKSAGRVIEILVQINISGETSKTGITPDETEVFIREAAEFDNISIKGLMTIAPYNCEKGQLRTIFGTLRKKFIDMGSKSIDNVSMDFLSMGMSGDFETAIEEGSNMIRLGTAIFGTRTN